MSEFTTMTPDAVASATNGEVIGGLADAKEMSTLVPPAKRVKFFIKGIKDYSIDSAGQPRDWKFLSLELYLEDGIEKDGKILYKNKVMWTNVCYYAGAKYNHESPFFKNKTYLVPLKRLAQAFDLELETLTIDVLKDTIQNKYVLADIVQTAETEKRFDETTGETKRVKTGEFINEIKNFAKAESGF